MATMENEIAVEGSKRTNKLRDKSKVYKNVWTKNDKRLNELKTSAYNLLPDEFSSVKLSKLDAANQNYYSFHEAIYPVIALAHFFSLMPVNGIASNNPRDLKFKHSTFQFIYFLMVFMTMSGLIALTIAWMIVMHVQFNITGTIMFYVTNFGVLVYFYMLAREWPELMVQWYNIEKKFPTFQTKKERKNLAVKVKVITFLFMICALLEHSLSIASGVYNAYICVEFYNPSERYFTKSYTHVFWLIRFSLPISVLVQILHFYCTFIWNFMDLFIIVISVGLSTLLKQINYNMDIVKSQIVPAVFWETHRNYYQDFCDLLTSVNKALAWLILLSFSSNLYFMCLQLLNIVKPSDNLVHAVYFWYSLSFLITRTISVALYASNVYEESRKPIEILQNVPKNGYSMEVKRFLQQVVNNKVALNGNNFFQITRQLILKLAGTVVTYELVLIQFYAENNTNLDNTDKCA